jgi:peptidoglycan-associated lipoprotein
MYNYSTFVFSRHCASFHVKQEPGMKKSIVTLLAGISMAALLVGGCANKEAVKKEEAVVPVAATEKVVPAMPATEVMPADKIVQPKPEEPTKPVQQEVAPVVAEKPAPVEIKFETVYFDFDKAELRQDSRDVLSKNAETILKSLAGAKIKIEGHCDERGSAEYNLALGERRAKSSQAYLTTLGVKAENLSIISYGKEKPAVLGSDEAAWAKNRRAEFVIVK